MKLRKLTSLLLAAVMVLSLAACGGSPAASNSTPPAESKGAEATAPWPPRSASSTTAFCSSMTRR